MSSLLCICDQGYRASVEEQDDTVVWISHMLQKADNTSTAMLLRGSAVNYAYKGQEAVAVNFGDWTQAHPANLPRDLAAYIADGGALFVLSEDVASHGLSAGDLIDGAKPVARSAIAKLVGEYDLVSPW